jgi:adhesin transport system outer membrane protein
MTFNRQICSAIALLLASLTAQAQQPADPLRTAVEQALNTNPEVTAKFNAYRASLDAVDAARGGFYPRLDLNAEAGRETDRITNRDPVSLPLSRREAGLTLSQLLWDGLGTTNAVERTGHDRLARYFDLLDATEQTALEAARAYVDVQRYRKLVQLAEDNYVQHRFAYLQIQSRFKAGVGRGVDLEQAGARVALAESNLTTEVANLHDVTVRYQRVVGVAPPKDLPQMVLLKDGIPATTTEVMNLSVARSAAVSSSIETLRSARSSVESRKATYQPRIDARLRAIGGRNVEDIQDRTRDTSAEIVLSWNLFNGGSDQARVRQQANLLNQATDLRDKTCRDTRQTAEIAFNDTRKLIDQLVYLDRNTIAIEKARDAYHQQFDIGQRSLLDLLNAENELYTARRAYANAQYDLGFAYVRTQSALSQLVPTLGVSRVDNVANDAAGWAQGDDAPTRCPTIVADTLNVDRSELDARAKQLAESAPTPTLPASAPPSSLAPANAPRVVPQVRSKP